MRNRACRDLQRFAVIFVGCIRLTLRGRWHGALQDRESSGRSVAGRRGGLDRDLPDGGGVSGGTPKGTGLSTGAGSRPGRWRSAGRGARQERLQLLERPGRRTWSKVRSRIRTPRTPKGLKLSAASSRTRSCPSRQGGCPKGLTVPGRQRRPGGASLVAIPSPLPLVKKCVAGLDRGAARFKERRDLQAPGAARQVAKRLQRGSARQSGRSGGGD